ncbi:hypothetical protein ACFO5K_10405 [Nocardia halotolerans]|uniref:Uncharacterized protein n=1 Tax=Nocardia halotolerans TaxID=1755878 RepID=A0ABV8VES7_9NOCA
MSTIPTRDVADFAEQLAFVDDTDHEAGADLDALVAQSDPVRTGFGADPADRFEQCLTVPIPDDDYPLAY